MTPSEYHNLFEEELSKGVSERYDAAKIELIQLNQRRQHRWNKTLELNADLENEIVNIKNKMSWILITEPWCGDSAPIFPFLERLASLNDKIHLSINLRDGEDSMIDNYLSKGSKSIPILIVRDYEGNDLFKWGSRSKDLQLLVDELKKSDLSTEDQKIAQQKWYNQDKGKAFQDEFLSLIREHR